MIEENGVPRPRRRLLRMLSGLTRRQRPADGLLIGELIADLGDKSFGWSLLLFGLLNLLPLPIGANMLTSLPILIVCVQMIMGYPHVRLPRFLAERTIPRSGLRRLIAFLRPFIHLLERIAQPRLTRLFTPRGERLLAMFVLLMAVALFLPIPFSGWGPALTILILSVGLVEKDGYVVAAGIVFGIGALLVVVGAVAAIILGLKSFAI